MLNEFLNKFKKASFNDKMKETISKFDSFSVMVDRERVSIAVKAELSSYVKPSKLFELEAEIKKAYSLNSATVYPHYNVEFEASHMDGIIETLKQVSKLDYGFFDGSTYHYDKSTGVFVIKLRKNITSAIPEANGAELFIMQCVRDQFGVQIILKFEYEEIDIFEYRSDRESALAQSIREQKFEIAKEIPKDAPRASFDEAKDEEAYDFEKDGKYLVTVGKMTLDITSPEPIYGERRNWSFTPISQVKNDSAVCIAGKLFLVETKENYENEKITYTVYITDNSASVMGRFSCLKKEAPKIKAPMYVTVAGKAEKRRIFDRNKNEWVEDDELTIAIKAISKCKVYGRQDEAEEKRVELHLHTNMSATDALSDAADIMARAHDWGMPAVAFTDHGTLQAYPIVMSAAKKYPDVKPIYGIEGYLVDDTARAVFRYEDSLNTKFDDDEFIIFDIETTGLSPKTCGITQIGALKYKSGEIIGEFSTFVDCGKPIPENIVHLTGITDEMVKGAPNECEAVKRFLEFCGSRMLVAHNANFDISFIRRVADENEIPFENPYLDTVALSRYINSDLKKHTLDTLARYFNLGEFDHHKADADTEMLAKIFECMSRKLAANGIFTINEMNAAMANSSDPKRLKSYHIIILVKNKAGLKNLYKLVSRSYLDYYHKHPRIPKTLLAEYREGLVIGSACSSGELYDAILQGRPDNELYRIADFYDYLEVQPDCNNGYLIDENQATVEQLHDNVRKIIAIANKQKKLVVATGDVHFMDPEDEIYRQIMLRGKGFSDAMRETGIYFRTTNEMLAEFTYLGEEEARRIVIENPKKVIADFDDIKPIPDGTFTPKIDGAEEELQTLCEQTAMEMYGFKGEIPEIVRARMDKELNSIIKNGFAVLYVIARRLVQNSEEHGYLVGSRGSVGSSFAATLAKISEVNPLPPHYACPNCKYSEFFTDGSVGSGFDLPDKDCPECGTRMRPDGHDIPFETFLGFHGEKAPDIDLNFSGDVQSEAHKFTEVLFGKENIFRAGTVGTLQDKNCFGYVKKFLEEENISLTRAEQSRLVYGFVGVQKTTGQHPGGIVVIPKEHEIYDFTPVQYPANKASSGVITTHFAFEYLHDTILKLDILGHDVPTYYRIFKDFTGIDVRDIPMNDKNVIELFASTKPLGVTPEQIGCPIGTMGIPEFGTDYSIQMILDAKPKTFADLLQISGLSHGTGIWLGNGKDLIESGTCTIDQIIGTRDSIMVYLMHKGLDSAIAFNAMERTRKGKGLLPEQEEAMREKDVPQWYIDSCNKIQYMFPKAHAAAYTIASLRLGWFKVYQPVAYYAAYFTIKRDFFDGELVMKGKAKIEERLKTLREMPNLTAKDEGNIIILRIVLEMLARGFSFLPVEIGKSEATYFIPENGKIRLPLCSLNGLGESVAEKIVEVVKNGEASTIEELRVKAQINKSVMDLLAKNNCFGDIPESDQLTMF